MRALCPNMSGTGCEGGWSEASFFTETGAYGICRENEDDDDYLVSLTGPYWHQRCLDDGSGMYHDQASFFYDSACTSPTGNQGDPHGGYDQWYDLCSGRRRLQS